MWGCEDSRRFRSALVSWVTLCCAAAAGAAEGQHPADRPVKKLIEFGWDEPDTAFLRQHIEESVTPSR